MEKKDLERLFREKFKGFQETPDEKVWNSIEASLDKKKKKRVIPIWWQMGGVAALLAILFYIVNPFAGDTGQETPTVTGTDQNEMPYEERDMADPEETIDFNAPDNQIELTETNSTSNGVEKQSFDKEDVPLMQNYLVQEGEEDQVPPNAVETVSRDKGTPNKQTPQENYDAQQIVKTEEAVAEIDEKDKVRPEAFPEDQQNGNLTPNQVTDGEEEAVAVNQEEGKKSIFEAIEEKEDQEVALAEGPKNRWSVGPSVAPIYFDSFGEGSPVHSNFSSNSKSGNINLSYGLTVAYDLGKRLTVRSGVHKVDFGYDTNDIVFSSSLNSSSTEEFDNINFSQSSRNLVVESRANEPVDNTSAADFIARSPEFEGRMVQQMEYLEVPLELNYALIDKKFGVNLIGGVSSLFLIDNSVSLESGGLVTEVGEANNVNTMNFSTNVGVGLDYEFSPKMQIRLEPVFKYQLNTFSDAAGNFRPFSVGVYSGVSFRF